MGAPQVAFGEFPKDSTDFFGYGLGWLTGVHRGHYQVSHNGGIDGFISFAGFLPKEKIAVVVLTNSDSGGMFTESLALAIFDWILGVEKEDWMFKLKEKNDLNKTFFQQEQAKIKDELSKGGQIAYPFSDYVGEFEDPGYGTIYVQIKGSDLFASYNNLSIPLFHKCYDNFIGVFSEGSWYESFHCSFVRDHFGEISQLHIPMENKVKAIVFKKKVNI